jgi:hypothetical protein
MSGRVSTAVRFANVPESEFEDAVDGEKRDGTL